MKEFRHILKKTTLWTTFSNIHSVEQLCSSIADSPECFENSLIIAGYKIKKKTVINLKGFNLVVLNLCSLQMFKENGLKTLLRECQGLKQAQNIWISSVRLNEILNLAQLNVLYLKYIRPQQTNLAYNSIT